MVKKITAINANETQKVADEFTKKLRGGEVVALYGDLGSGKTTFVQGVAKALGVKEKVQSPTFVMVKEYKVKGERLKVKGIIHIDLYRLKSTQEAEAIGTTEYFSQPNTIIFVEWPQVIERYLPKNTIRIRFEHIGENSREIIINTTNYH